MIACMSFTSAAEFGTALIEFHKLRYRLYVEQEKWSVPHFDGMEYDEFDTPAAVYLVHIDDETEAVTGGVRMLPTTRPYMMETLWPDLSVDPLPKSPRVWEGTRLAADPALPLDARRAVLARLSVAYVEFALDVGCDEVLFEMPARMMAQRKGVLPGFIEQTGPLMVLEDGTELVGGRIAMSDRLLAFFKDRIGVEGPVLTYPSRGFGYERVARGATAAA